MSKSTEKKSNPNKAINTQKRKEARKARILRRKKSNPNQNAWRIGLAGRLRRLNKLTIKIGADRLKQVQARIAEIEQIYKDHGEKV
jgi:membrane-bound lytic murein transglycosylase B